MKEELKLEHLKFTVKRHFLSLPLQICNNNRQFQALKTVLESLTEREAASMEKIVFKPCGIKCHLKLHIFQLCVCDVYMRLGISMILGSSLEENSLKELGVTTTVKIET